MGARVHKRTDREVGAGCQMDKAAPGDPEKRELCERLTLFLPSSTIMTLPFVLRGNLTASKGFE